MFRPTNLAHGTFYVCLSGLKLVTSLIAHGRCTQHLRWIRGCDAHPAWIGRMSRKCYTRKPLCVRCASPCIMQCCAHLPRNKGDVYHAMLRAPTAQQGMWLLDHSNVEIWEWISLTPYFSTSFAGNCRNLPDKAEQVCIIVMKPAIEGSSGIHLNIAMFHRRDIFGWGIGYYQLPSV
jgi:hypothetical protein